MPVHQTVVARNTLDGIVVLGTKSDDDYISWEASGDPNGDDVRFVNENLAASSGFRTALAKGILVLEEDETDAGVVEALARQVESYKQRVAVAAVKATESLDRPTSRDVLTKFCVGPNSRGNGTCEQPVAIPEKAAKSIPPLCNQHVHLKHDYVPSDVTEGVNAGTTEWVRVNIDKRV